MNANKVSIPKNKELILLVYRLHHDECVSFTEIKKLIADKYGIEVPMEILLHWYNSQANYNFDQHMYGLSFDPHKEVYRGKGTGSVDVRQHMESRRY